MICSICKVDKSESDFPRNKRQRSYRCKECRSDYNRQWRYGLSPEKYQEFRLEQNGRCAICGIPEAEVRDGRLVVDHCHASGKVRGLLCHLCNSAIGNLMDSPELLRRALAYLETDVNQDES